VIGGRRSAPGRGCAYCPDLPPANRKPRMRRTVRRTERAQVRRLTANYR
jgi:hypothetical protein